MPEIRQLPPSVINKIAAGEVIERPASVVKELLENSVDAGASRIDVHLEKGGTELIRVADNGCGIDQEQLLLAVASHATSKLREAEDLFSVQSMGFRGEALASIAEVSRFLLRSRPEDQNAGAELRIHCGQAEPIAPCGCPTGTQIEVRDLFVNTPVRRRFLRTVQTELGNATEGFNRIAVAYPQIHFTLQHNERTVHDLPPEDNLRERIIRLFGSELGDALIWVDNQYDEVRVSGFVADPMVNRGNNRMQYLFLNNRFIRDRALQHALGEAYRGLLLHGRFPVSFLRLDMPPELVDVNVHPTKLEVRFQNSGKHYSQILGTIRQKFLTTDLTKQVAQPGMPAAPELPQPAPETTASLPLTYAPVQPPTAPRLAPFEQTPGFKPYPDNGTPTAPFPSTPQEASSFPPASSYSTPPTEAQLQQIGLQVHDRYLITESEEGVVIIDQHALHERILYEQLREKVLAGKVETQKLLVPEPLTLPPAETAAVLDAQETLAQMGILVEPFGGDTILVTGYPAMLHNLGPAELVRQVVELLLTDGKVPDRRDVLDSLLHMVSCKAAVKAGDHLSNEEVNELLQQRHLCQDSHHCPHGRPTSLVFTREELDRRFLRT